MKKIVFLLSLFLLGAFFVGKTQTITYTPQAASGYQFKYLKADSGIAIPLVDTSLRRGVNRIGAMVARPQDSVIYFWNGVKWGKVSTDITGLTALINAKVDSLTVSGSILYYWKNGVAYGVTLAALSGTLQDVTDNGNITTNDIIVNNLYAYKSVHATQQGPGDYLFRTMTTNAFVDSLRGYIQGDSLLNNNLTWQLPDTSGVFVMSVNGNRADKDGNITLSTAGTDTSVVAAYGLTKNTLGNIISLKVDTTTLKNVYWAGYGNTITAGQYLGTNNAENLVFKTYGNTSMIINAGVNSVHIADNSFIGNGNLNVGGRLEILGGGDAFIINNEGAPSSNAMRVDIENKKVYFDESSLGYKVGIGLATLDSAFNVQNGIWGKRGVRFSGLPTGVGTKALRIDGSGNLSMADTTISGGGGGGITVGTTTITSGTSGAIPFNNAGVYGEDATQLFWDNTNNRLGIGTNAPASPIHLIHGAGASDVTIQGLTTGTTHTSYPTKGRWGSNFNHSYFSQNARYDGAAWVADDVNKPTSGFELNNFTSAQGLISFYTSQTNNAGRGTETVRFNYDGNVGMSNGLYLGSVSTSPAASAKLEISSTTQGLLIPRLTTTEQTAISSPANGLTIYNTDSSDYVVYKSSAWRLIGTDGSHYVGTTLIPKNRASASQTLTGISGLTSVANMDINSGNDLSMSGANNVAISTLYTTTIGDVPNDIFIRVNGSASTSKVDIGGAINSNFYSNGFAKFNGSGDIVTVTEASFSGIPQSAVTNLTTDLSGKQATLVSGTNIKTVNGNSLVGSGNVTISGSGLTFSQVSSLMIIRY